MSPVTYELPCDWNGILIVRPCHETPQGDIAECGSSEAEFWGLYGGTTSGPTMHIEDFPSIQDAQHAADAMLAMEVVHAYV